MGRGVFVLRQEQVDVAAARPLAAARLLSFGKASVISWCAGSLALFLPVTPFAHDRQTMRSSRARLHVARRPASAHVELGHPIRVGGGETLQFLALGERLRQPGERRGAVAMLRALVPRDDAQSGWRVSNANCTVSRFWCCPPGPPARRVSKRTSASLSGFGATSSGRRTISTNQFLRL